MYCPDCPLELHLVTVGRRVTISLLVNLTCQEQSWTYTMFVVTQPGKYDVEVLLDRLVLIWLWNDNRRTKREPIFWNFLIGSTNIQWTWVPSYFFNYLVYFPVLKMFLTLSNYNIHNYIHICPMLKYFFTILYIYYKLYITSYIITTNFTYYWLRVNSPFHGSWKVTKLLHETKAYFYFSNCARTTFSSVSCRSLVTFREPWTGLLPVHRRVK